MNTREIESAIEQLSPSEVARLAEWFQEYQARVWDNRIALDVQSGRLDSLIEETEREFDAGEHRPL